MENSVLEAIKRFRLLDGVGNVTVALSGGADSMSLLYALTSLSKRLGITVSAAHLNHMIRGAEADRDEEFVRAQCKVLGVKLFCERSDVPEYAARHRISLELAAREVRYEFLERVSEGAVATAHTASDNLETMLFNLTRGTSLKGLRGIPPKRGIFIRPLLLCTRADVEDYCSRNGIPYVTDSTNLSDDYMRNKLRHTVIPALKQINPSVEISALRTSGSLTEDEKFLSSLAENYISDKIGSDKRLDVSDFKTTSPSVAKRVIRIYFEKILPNISLDNRHIGDIYSICLNGGRTSLPSDISAVVSENLLYYFSDCRDKQKNGSYIVEIHEVTEDFINDNINVNNLFLKNSLDCDKIVGKSVIRTRQAGDSIRLVNRGCTKSLKKLFNECSVPADERELLPVIADDLGVIWIYGIGPAQRCAVTKSTKKALIIQTESETII